jgi:DNA-binding HxlR family transcriptional regulator
MRSRQPKREPLDPCPLETVLAFIQPKWTPRILQLLFFEPHHFGALKRALPGISAETLAARLEALVVAGIIQGETVNRRRTYSVTPHGRTLEPLLNALAAWGLNELIRQGVQWNSPVGPVSWFQTERGRPSGDE